MGNGIAHTFAQHGYKVTLFDISQAALDEAVRTITANLERQVAKGALTAGQQADALARINTSANMQTAVADADLVIEAATENKAVKLGIFKELGTYCNRKRYSGIQYFFNFYHANCCRN